MFWNELEGSDVGTPAICDTIIVYLSNPLNCETMPTSKTRP